MPRNPKFALTAAQQATADWAKTVILPVANKEGQISVSYEKRNGEEKVITGTAVRVEGYGCSSHVKIMTDDGIRSANLWAIKGIRVL